MLFRISIRQLPLIILSGWMLFLQPVVMAGTLDQRKEVRDFINMMVHDHHFSRAELQRIFRSARTSSKIIDAISRPAESKPWFEYRPIFLTKQRISLGVDFLNDHRDTLKKAEARYGVPPEIITAIIGVESLYGHHKGGYRVIDSLSTLAFDYPERSSFFRSELEQFLLMAREEKRDPLEFMGSYAGAMGQPQFIASSFRHYAVDFNDDGHRDLWNNVDDIVGSIANYFNLHGWQHGEPVASRATVSGASYQQLTDKGLKPYIRVDALEKQGIRLQTALPAQDRVALIELTQKDGMEYWVGLNNFYVITRYNHSALYAMAVYQLSQEILAGAASQDGKTS